jgi:uncharacterized membrane protein
VTWTVIRFLHLLAMAFFVGGQIMLAVAVVPAVLGEGIRRRCAASSGDSGPARG